jgi:hypothetical protein
MQLLIVVMIVWSLAAAQRLSLLISVLLFPGSVPVHERDVLDVYIPVWLPFFGDMSILLHYCVHG